LDGVTYRFWRRKEPQVVILVTVVKEVTMLHHNLVFTTHPYTKKTFQLFLLQNW
jgi:hypothetical protein